MEGLKHNRELLMADEPKSESTAPELEPVHVELRSPAMAGLLAWLWPGRGISIKVATVKAVSWCAL